MDSVFTDSPAGSLKFICNPKSINIHSTFAVVHSHKKGGEKFVLPTYTFPAEAEQEAICFLVSALKPWTSILAMVCLMPRVCVCVYVCVCMLFLLVILLFKMAPNYCWNAV